VAFHEFHWISVAAHGATVVRLLKLVEPSMITFFVGSIIFTKAGMDEIELVSATKFSERLGSSRNLPKT